METVVLLAGSPREADAYRQDTGKRYAVYAHSPAVVHRATTIIELPEFKTRRDRFRLEQARDSRIKYGPNVEYIDAGDWVRPVRVIEEPEPVEETATAGLYEIDLKDETVLAELKIHLNKVGLTLKRMPKKEADAALAPRMISAEPVQVSEKTLKQLSFPDVEF